MNISVLVLQRALQTTGFNPGTLDGRWGPTTHNALLGWYSSPHGVGLPDWRAEAAAAGVSWPPPSTAIAPTGVRNITLPAAAVRALTTAGASGAAIAAEPRPAPQPSGIPGLPPPIFGPADDPATRTAGDVFAATGMDDLLARLAAAQGGDTTGLPGLPALSSSSTSFLNRGTTRRRSSSRDNTVLYTVVGVGVLALVGGAIFYLQSRKR